MERLRAFGGGKALEAPARKLIPASSAVGLLSIAARGRRAYFDGGRGVQRVWLEATRRKLTFQPYSSLVFLLARLEDGDGIGLDQEEKGILGQLRADLARIFPPRSSSHTELLLFRLAYAGTPTSRALRRSIDDVLTADLSD
jgi:hypothetical protein